MYRIGTADRRARLARRHRLAPAHRAADVEAATAAMVCLHATDPASVYLSARARVDALATADVDRALYQDRTLVRQLAMRRTLFAIPRNSMSMIQAAASARVADQERRRLVRDVAAAGLRDDAEAWFEDASNAVLEALADGRQATAAQLRAEIPLLQAAISYGAGRTWGGQAPVAPRVLTCLGAAGRVLRAANLGGWTISRPTWTTTSSWLGHSVAAMPEAQARAQLVAAWLRVFGPGTVADIRWWLGSTLTFVRRALVDVGAVEVELDAGTGYVLPDDGDTNGEVPPWVALLPALDPTTMGWYERHWYLGPHRDRLFDSSGNAGPTAWSDGRVVGGWRQADDGAVVVDLLEDVGRETGAALQDEAARLTGWLAGVVVRPRFPSPLQRSGAGG